MLIKQPSYKFYATLLDAYNWCASSEKEEALQELVDKINRIPFYSEAAAKGTAFNKIVDIAIDKGIPDNVVSFSEDGFKFPASLVAELQQILYGAIPQYKASTQIQTKFGIVEIYGYIDYLLLDKAIDLKCTGSFEIGKYKNSMQRHVYPICLADEGIEVDEFEFLVTDYKSIFREGYGVDLKQSKQAIINTCEELINFLHIKRDLITDKKIFALD